MAALTTNTLGYATSICCFRHSGEFAVQARHICTYLHAYVAVLQHGGNESHSSGGREGEREREVVYRVSAAGEKASARTSCGDSTFPVVKAWTVTYRRTRHVRGVPALSP